MGKKEKIVQINGASLIENNELFYRRISKKSNQMRHMSATLHTKNEKFKKLNENSKLKST